MMSYNGMNWSLDIREDGMAFLDAYLIWFVPEHVYKGLPRQYTSQAEHSSSKNC